MTGATVYGDEYEIACNWIAESKQERDDQGAEFVSRHIIFTEDPRPKYLDMIRLSGFGIAFMSGSSEEQSGSEVEYAGSEILSGSGWEEIRAKTSWDMALFNDSMDFKLVT